MNNKRNLRFMIGLSILSLMIGSISCEPYLMPIDALAHQIDIRTIGLVYISESDSDVHEVHFADKVPSNSIDNFLRAGHFPANIRIEERNFTQWINPSVNRDIRWRELRDYLNKNLGDMKTFIVGSIQVDIYAVGYYHGTLMGIRMKAIETGNRP